MSKLAKKTVDLEGEARAGSGGKGPPRGSRIRRDPVPVGEAKTIVRFRDDNEQRTVIAGVLFFAFALFVILLNFSDYTNDYF